ncbi:hypothetical protein [Gorillibacterium timonense]|uniref:hypothetical protein n=1 Tax=Gorillibacterium timonense TaxID=1689269 RepID=UPI00071E2C4E|nr:hypothetical protein [Gorillibacterium timonense]
MKHLLPVGILLIILLTGCTHINENNSEDLQSSATVKNTRPSQSLESPVVTQEITSFEKGVFVDFFKLNQDFITDEIRQRLKDNLEALVNKDEVKFKATLLEGHDTPGNMDFVKNTNQYRFLDISRCEYYPKGEGISISVLVQIWRDKRIDEVNLGYYFEPNEAGEWKIQLID